MAVNLTGATPDSAADQKLAALAAAQTVSTKNSGEDDAMGEVGGAEALLYLRVSTKRQAQSGGQAEGFSFLPNAKQRPARLRLLGQPSLANTLTVASPPALQTAPSSSKCWATSRRASIQASAT